jgi:hypothetical protein
LVLSFIRLRNAQLGDADADLGARLGDHLGHPVAEKLKLVEGEV